MRSSIEHIQDSPLDVAVLEEVSRLEIESLPLFENVYIVSKVIHPRPDLDTKWGYYFERQLQFNDGTKRIEYLGLSFNPISEIPVYKKPAWFTAPERGFNKLTSDSMHKIGRNTITGGISTNKAHSLYRNAWDNHLSLNDIPNDFSNINTEIIDCEGDSNGAMEATGVIAYAEKFDRQVRDAYLVDPCLVHKIASYDLSKFIKHPDYLPRELINLGKHALYLIGEEGDTKEYLKTLRFSKEFVIGNLLLSRALFWGEFGHVLAHIPQDQSAHYRLYEYSIANQKKDFFSIVRSPNKDSRQNVNIEVIPGTHISIANPKNLEEKTKYLSQR